jgi:hypothetical protein
MRLIVVVTLAGARFKNCSELFPMVVCPLPLGDHSGHDDVVNPGWVTFVKLFDPTLPK